MDSSITQQATMIFTAATVMIGISLLVITPTWRTIEETLNRRPQSQRKIVLKFGKIKDKMEKTRAEFLLCLFLGCCCLIIGIILNLISTIGASATMLGLHLGPFEETNVNQAAYFLLGSVGMLVSGFFYIGIVRIVEAFRFIQGKTSFLTYNSGFDQVEKTETFKRDE